MASALEKSGGVEYIVNGLVAGLGGFGPYALMAGLFRYHIRFQPVYFQHGNHDPCRPDRFYGSAQDGDFALSFSHDRCDCGIHRFFHPGGFPCEYAYSWPRRVSIQGFCQGWDSASDSRHGGYPGVGSPSIRLY